MSQTRAEFESTYNGGDVLDLVIRGRLSIECRCEYENCNGWKMSHLDWLADDTTLYGNTSSEVAEAVAHRLNLLEKVSENS